MKPKELFEMRVRSAGAELLNQLSNYKNRSASVQCTPAVARKLEKQLTEEGWKPQYKKIDKYTHELELELVLEYEKEGEEPTVKSV